MSGRSHQVELCFQCLQVGGRINDSQFSFGGIINGTGARRESHPSYLEAGHKFGVITPLPAPWAAPLSVGIWRDPI